MGTRVNFDMNAIRAYAYSKVAEWEEVMIQAYKSACIEMVKRAKQTNTYKDQTSKLRSSIGCVLYHKGVEVFNYFESEVGTMGEQGVAQGLAFARRKAEESGDHSLVAVVVAGAEYARYVEAKGFDVLTGSSYGFEADLQTQINMGIDTFKEHIVDKFGL